MKINGLSNKPCIVYTEDDTTLTGGWSERGRHNSPKNFLTVLYHIKEPNQAKEHQAENNEMCVTLCKLTLSNPSLTLQFGINQAA